jgi:hypothetical protein
MKLSPQDKTPFPVAFCLTAVISNPGGFVYFFVFEFAKNTKAEKHIRSQLCLLLAPRSEEG